MKDKKSPGRQKGEGMMDEAKGKAKQAWGDVTDDKSKHAEGQMDEMKGKAKQKVGEAREDVRKKI